MNKSVINFTDKLWKENSDKYDNLYVHIAFGYAVYVFFRENGVVHTTGFAIFLNDAASNFDRMAIPEDVFEANFAKIHRETPSLSLCLETKSLCLAAGLCFCVANLMSFYLKYKV